MAVAWCFVLLSSALIATDTITLVAAQTNYEIPPVCEGQTPVRYLGIQTAGDQPQAEQSLGIKLNSDALDIVRIYTTLDLHQLQDEDNQTETVQFAPGQCPGNGQLPVSKMINGTANLAYVWARSTPYANAYLRIQAPTRYYSLGTLSKKEAWKAKDNQTLQLAVPGERRSRDCWLASNTHQRTAFIHRLLNRTLTRILQQVNRHVQWLDGTLYVRVEGEDTLFSRWPFPFGKDYGYESCQTSLIPLSIPIDNASSLNYTICSHWLGIGDFDAWLPEDLAMFFNIFYSVGCCIAFFSLWPWLYGASYTYWSQQILEIYSCEDVTGQRKFEVRNLKPVSGSKVTKYFRNGGFPGQLRISHLLHVEGVLLQNKQWTWENLLSKLMRFPSAAFNPVWYLFSAVMIMIVLALYVNIGSSFASGQEFDSKSNIWSPCSQPGWSAYVVVATILVFFLITFLLIFCGIDYRLAAKSQAAKSELPLHLADVYKPAKRGWSRWKDSPSLTTAVVVKGGLSCSILLLVPFILVPLIANLILVFGFTLIGLLSFYRIELLSFIAVSKIIIFDLLKVTQVNRNLSPILQDCKYAIDEAARQLEEEMVSASAERLANSMGESQATNNADTLHKQFESLFGVKDMLASRSVVSRINSSMTRAFLILCVYSQACDVPQALRQAVETHDGKTGDLSQKRVSLRSTRLLKLSRGSDTVDGSKCVYSEIYKEIVRGIRMRHRSFVARAVGGLFALLGCLFMLQLVLVHISQLTKISSWLQLLIPASIVLQGVISHFKTRWKKFRDARSALVLEAKSILLLFITDQKEGIFTADRDDGSIVIQDTKSESSSQRTTCTTCWSPTSKETHLGEHASSAETAWDIQTTSIGGDPIVDPIVSTRNTNQYLGTAL